MLFRLCLLGFSLIAPLSYASDLERDFYIDAGVSSLGAYAAPRLEIMPNLALRVPLFAAEVGGVSVNRSGNGFRGDLTSYQGGVMLDYTPWDNGVFFSGGVLWGGYDLTGHLSQIDTARGLVSGDLGFEFAQSEDVAPVLSVGYRYVSEAGVQAGLELGGKFARHNLQLTGLDGLDPADRQAVEEEMGEINDGLRHAPVVPFLSASIGFTF